MAKELLPRAPGTHFIKTWLVREIERENEKVRDGERRIDKLMVWLKSVVRNA